MANPKPLSAPKISRAFTLPAEFLAALASGSYDAIDLKNSGQRVRLTRFGAATGEVTIGGAGKIEVKRGIGSKFNGLPAAGKAAIIAGVAGLLIVGVAAFALRR